MSENQNMWRRRCGSCEIVKKTDTCLMGCVVLERMMERMKEAEEM